MAKQPPPQPQADERVNYAYGMIQATDSPGCWKLVKVRLRGDPANPTVKVKFGEAQPRMVAFDELTRKINELFLQERK